jgi:hypothetical protein
MKTLTICKNKVGYWISPKGEIFESEFEDHAIVVAKIFDITYKKDNSILYYRIAFENNFVRVCLSKDELNVQLTKPATKDQVRILRDLHEHSERSLVVFGCNENYTDDRITFNKAIQGNTLE